MSFRTLTPATLSWPETGVSWEATGAVQGCGSTGQSPREWPSIGSGVAPVDLKDYTPEWPKCPGTKAVRLARPLHYPPDMETKTTTTTALGIKLGQHWPPTVELDGVTYDLVGSKGVKRYRNLDNGDTLIVKSA